MLHASIDLKFEQSNSHTSETVCAANSFMFVALKIIVIATSKFEGVELFCFVSLKI